MRDTDAFGGLKKPPSHDAAEAFPVQVIHLRFHT
jgi:hypothetical protein